MLDTSANATRPARQVRRWKSKSSPECSRVSSKRNTRSKRSRRKSTVDVCTRLPMIIGDERSPQYTRSPLPKAAPEEASDGQTSASASDRANSDAWVGNQRYELRYMVRR